MVKNQSARSNQTEYTLNWHILKYQKSYIAATIGHVVQCIILLAHLLFKQTHLFPIILCTSVQLQFYVILYILPPACSTYIMFYIQLKFYAVLCLI